MLYGASGSVGKHNMRLFVAAGDEVTAVCQSGNVSGVDGLIAIVKGDAKNLIECENQCAGFDVIVCTVGLYYTSKVWNKEWPLIIKSLLNAAEKNYATFVFADNLYMFGPEAEYPLRSTCRAFTKFGSKPALRSSMDEMILSSKCNCFSISSMSVGTSNPPSEVAEVLVKET